MKICFKNAHVLYNGISYVADELGMLLCDANEADIVINVTETEESIVRVSVNEKSAEIVYGGGAARFFRGLCILCDMLKKGEKDFDICESPIFKTNGAMIDMSRNIVMNVRTVKQMMRKMALMGMNTFMLYTEDTYEIEGRPYFGYMRGRYTREELCELDAYAACLGIELIPCIQVLGHLAAHLAWGAASAYKDTQNVMLVGAEETYRLIDEMFKTVRACFKTRRVHIGMDETHDIGRGKYLDKNGYRAPEDIYFEHLERVINLAQENGLEPMMWSDMFFRLAGKNIEGYTDYHMLTEFSDEIKAKVPHGIKEVFWDYYQEKEEFYSANIYKHKDLFGEKPIFAGGVWTWSGYGPIFSRSVRYSAAALDACRKNGVDEIIATAWANGGDSSLMLALAGLAWYADYDYKGYFKLESAKACFKRACGAEYDDIIACELIEHPQGGDINISRALLANDPLIGLVDKHIEGIDMAGYYKSVSERLANPKGELGIFKYEYDVIRCVALLLENKADFGVRLKAAYDKGDGEALKALALECDVIYEKTRALRDSHREAWYHENKPFGFEVCELHYGAHMSRIETAKWRINAYLDGDIDKIEELCEERLPLMGSQSFGGGFLWAQFGKYFTAGANN